MSSGLGDKEGIEAGGKYPEEPWYKR